MVLAHTIVDAPNHGASSRAAAISAPSEEAPTTAASSSMGRRDTTADRVRRPSGCGATVRGRMTADALRALDRKHLWHPFTQQQGWMDEDFPIIDHADGCTLWDTDGRAYLDGVSSLWCTVHGHRHPALDIE